MVSVQSHHQWWNTCEDCHARLNVQNAWICPWCFSCAAKHFNIPNSKNGESCWNQFASEIRDKTLAPNTLKTYRQGFYKAEWPLDSPFRIMAYLDKAPPSDSSLKQWIAIATRIHESRLWPRPDFQHPLVKDFIKSLQHRPNLRKQNNDKKVMLNETELRKIFQCLKGNRHPTDQRNWAILIVQLFGVRRASEVLSLRVNDVHVADQTFVIRGVSKKTDKRQNGIFFKLPQSCPFDFNPAYIFGRYILSLSGKGDIIFPSYDPNIKKFKNMIISVSAWNRALRRLCNRANISVVSSHAIRRSAITLSPIELVEAVAQTGGWRSLCFWEVYRRFDIDQRMHAASNIGNRNKLQEGKSVLFI